MIEAIIHLEAWVRKDIYHVCILLSCDDCYRVFTSVRDDFNVGTVVRTILQDLSVFNHYTTWPVTVLKHS